MFPKVLFGAPDENFLVLGPYRKQKQSGISFSFFSPLLSCGLGNWDDVAVWLLYRCVFTKPAFWKSVSSLLATMPAIPALATRWLAQLG